MTKPPDGGGAKVKEIFDTILVILLVYFALLLCSSIGFLAAGGRTNFDWLVASLVGLFVIPWLIALNNKKRA